MTSAPPPAEGDRRSWGTIGTFFGVPVVIAPSWLLVAAFITLSFAELFAQSVDGAQGNWAYLMSLTFAILSAASVLLHELGHTAVALALGLRVRRVTIFLLGGVSELEPDPERARDELLVSAAGPLVSAGLSAGAWAVFANTDPGSLWHVEAALVAWSNLVIAVFNILPGLPLDGGRVLRAAVWGLGGSRLTATVVASWTGRVLALGVVAAGLLLPHQRWGYVSAAITVVLGIFLWIGASQSLRLARLTDRVPSLSLAALVRPAVWVVPHLPLSQALRLRSESGGRSVVVIDDGGRIRGLLDESRLRSIPVPQYPWTQVVEAARPVTPSQFLPVGLTGQNLLDACRAAPAPDYVVLDPAGGPLGTLRTGDLRASLQTDPDGARLPSPLGPR